MDEKPAPENGALPGRQAHPFAMGRSFSLGRNKQHQYVYRRGKSYPGGHLVLVYLRARELKVGFSVSAKVGNSVMRSRIRRMMREDFRLLRPSLKAGKYIVVARTRAASAEHWQLTQDLRALIARAKLFAQTGDQK